MSVTESLRGIEHELNIHDLVIEPEREKPEGFDARGILQDRDFKWEELELKNTFLFCELAAMVKMVFPEKLMLLKPDREKLEIVDEEIGIKEEPEDTSSAEYLKLLRNFVFAENLGEPQDVQWPVLNAHFLNLKSIGSDWPGILEIAKIAKFVVPNEKFYNPVDWRDIKAYLEECQQKNYWTDFANVTSALRILAPEAFSELYIDDNAWDGMNDELKKCSGRARIMLAAMMQILAAEKVEFTDNGLHLTMPRMIERKSFSESRAELPVRREF